MKDISPLLRLPFFPSRSQLSSFPHFFNFTNFEIFMATFIAVVLISVICNFTLFPLALVSLGVSYFTPVPTKPPYLPTLLILPSLHFSN